VTSFPPLSIEKARSIEERCNGNDSDRLSRYIDVTVATGIGRCAYA